MTKKEMLKLAFENSNFDGDKMKDMLNNLKETTGKKKKKPKKNTGGGLDLDKITEKLNEYDNKKDVKKKLEQNKDKYNATDAISSQSSSSNPGSSMFDKVRDHSTATGGILGGAIGTGAGHMYDRKQEEKSNKGKLIGALSGAGGGALLGKLIEKKSSADLDDGLEKIAYVSGMDKDYIKSIIKEAKSVKMTDDEYIEKNPIKGRTLQGALIGGVGGLALGLDKGQNMKKGIKTLNRQFEKQTRKFDFPSGASNIPTKGIVAKTGLRGTLKGSALGAGAGALIGAIQKKKNDKEKTSALEKLSANFGDLVSLLNEGKISQEELQKYKNYSPEKMDDLIKKIDMKNAKDVKPKGEAKKKILNKLKSNKGRIGASGFIGGSLGTTLGHNLYDKKQDDKSYKGKVLGGLAGASLGAGGTAARLAKSAAVRGMAEHYNDNERFIKDVSHRNGNESKDMTPPDLRKKLREHRDSSSSPSFKTKARRIANKNPVATGVSAGGLAGGLAGAIKGKIQGKNTAKQLGKGLAAGAGIGAISGEAKKLL